MAKLYPIGIQNFEKIRREGYLYIDKTALVCRLVKTGSYYFLSRPRRFGKSLLISTLEAYFQEAGRAGRDEKKAYAVLFYNKTDETKLKKRISDSFPPKKDVKNIYEALGNYYSLAIGSGMYNTFVFDFNVCHANMKRKPSSKETSSLTPKCSRRCVVFGTYCDGAFP